jgi:2-methylcitrate dehydratase PrpD
MTTVAEQLADHIAALDVARRPPPLRRKCDDLLVDVVGLCLAARRTDYVAATFAGIEEDGASAALGHGRRLAAAGAARVNGNAAHGGWRDDRARECLRVLRRLYDGDVDLSIFREEG